MGSTRSECARSPESLRHTRFGKPLDVSADRARPSVLEHDFSDTEPLATEEHGGRESDLQRHRRGVVHRLLTPL